MSTTLKAIADQADEMIFMPWIQRFDGVSGGKPLSLVQG